MRRDRATSPVNSSSSPAPAQRHAGARARLALTLVGALALAAGGVVAGCAARKSGPTASGRRAYTTSTSGDSVAHAPRAAGAAESRGYVASRRSYTPTAKASRRAPRSAPRPASADSSRSRRAPSVAPSTTAGGSSARREPPPPVPQARASLLTAASVADHDRYSNYLSYLSRHYSERNRLGLLMNRRVRMRVVDAKGRPVNDAQIRVNTGGHVVFGRTHADGWWDFFPGVSAPQAAGAASATVRVGQQVVRVNFKLPSHGDGQRLTVKLPGVAALAPRVLDLAFLIDVTGSMGDELRYVNREISDIVRRVKGAVANTKVRLGAVFYRDRTDSVPLRVLPFTNSVATFRRVMSTVRASGGGDYPEDLNAGLAAAMGRLSWTKGNAVRVLVVLADAPPKHYGDAQYRYGHAMVDAARRGIRLLPVAASGSNRTVEYLFRAMGAFTSTPYTYLTDDSGIGGRHQEADTDRVGVERFNQLLTRLIISDLRGKGMHEPGALGPQ